MAKGDDPKPIGWDEPPLPLESRAKSSSVALPRTLGIGQLMVWLIYFALLSLAGRQVYLYEQAVSRVMLGVVVGLGICYFGYWLAMRLTVCSFVGWIIFVIGFCVTTASTNGGLAIPTIPILIGAIVYLCFRKRASNQDALLGIIALAAERQAPLAPGVLAFSQQVTGNYKTWAEVLAELLRRGVPLPEAISGMPRLISRPAGLLIRTGADTGNLAKGIREAVVARAIRLPVARTMGTQLAYLGWVAFTGVMIVGFLMYFIMPKFEAIFYDFGIMLPEITIQMIRLSHVAVDFFWVPVLAGFIYGIGMMLNLFQGGDVSLFLFDRLFARRHTILILRSLVLYVEAERPIAPAMNALAHWYPTNWVRRKLVWAASVTGEGEDWIEALRSAGLISRSDAGVLTTAQRAGNLAWAIRELITTSERRWAFRIQGLMQIVFIGSMLILGALVFLLAVAYFAPLTTLIMRLSL